MYKATVYQLDMMLVDPISLYMTFDKYVYANYDGFVSGCGVESPAHASPMSERHRFFRNNLPRIAKLNSQSSTGTLGAHLGAAGLANFETIAVGKHQAAVFFDINSNQRLLWLSIFEMIKQNTDPSNFVQDFIKSVAQIGRGGWDTYFVHTCQNTGAEIPLRCDPVEAGKIYGAEDFSVFNNPEAYRYVRDMVVDGKIAVVELNLYDTPKLKQLAEVIQAFGLPISTIYLSNITSFPHSTSDLDSLAELLPKIMEPGGQIIDNLTEYTNNYQNLIAGPGPLDNTSPDFSDTI